MAIQGMRTRNCGRSVSDPMSHAAARTSTKPQALTDSALPHVGRMTCGRG